MVNGNLTQLLSNAPQGTNMKEAIENALYGYVLNLDEFSNFELIV